MVKVYGLQRLKYKIETEVDTNTRKGLLGEREVLSLLENNLPMQAIVIHDPTLLHYEADILVIEENIGFMFIEVKTWNERYIDKFHANGGISINKETKNPLKQTENYREELKRILASYEKDIHQLISSVVVFNGISKEAFLNRPEVCTWNKDAKEFFLRKHFFYPGDSSGLYSWLLNSRKFKMSRVSDCFTATELGKVIEVLFHDEEREDKKKTDEKRVPMIPKRTQAETLENINALVREHQSNRLNTKPRSKKESKKKSVVGLVLSVLALISLFYFFSDMGYEEDSYAGQEDISPEDYTFVDMKDESNHDPYNYFILADSQHERLDETQLYGLTKSDLRIARNEIYARHGYVFEATDLQNYFTSQTWYIPDESYSDELTDVEKYNITLIQSME